MNPDYLTSCPICGAQLSPVALSSETPPWQCFNCSRGWWASELTEAARAAFRPLERDFHGDGQAAADELDGVRQSEMDQASQRGTSLLPEQLGLVDPLALQSVSAIIQDESFGTQVAQVISERGA